MNWKNLLLCGVLCASPASLGAIELTVDGKANAKIYILEGSCQPQEYVRQRKREAVIQRSLDQAVFDLRDLIKRMSGAELEIVPVKSKDEIQGNAVVIGELADQCGEKATLPDPEGEAVLVKAQGNRLYLNGGGSKLGTAYAIYEFLKSQGIAFLMPDELGLYCPEKKTISMADGKIERMPAFPRRSIWQNGMGNVPAKARDEFVKWQLRNGEQPVAHSAYSAAGAVWHIFASKKYDQFFKEHPEAASLVIAPDGTRRYNRHQLNTTSPYALELMVDYVRNHFKDKPKDTPMSIGIGPADGAGFDMSPESMIWQRIRRDPATGYYDMTDLIVKFSNEIIDKIIPEYPNARMGFLLYNMYTDYPHTVKPSDKLYVTMADITQSRLHGACDAAVSPTRAYYKDVMEKWTAVVGKRLGLYHYNWNLADAALPYTRIRITGLDLPWEYKLGVSGYGDENIQQWSASAPGDWLLAQMMWDPSLDWKKVTEEFCRKAYGKGWKPMYDYWMFLAMRQAETSDETGSFFAFPQLYSRKDAQQMRAWMNEAEKLAESPKEKRRVQIAAFCVTQLENYLDFYEAYCDYRFADALKAVEKLDADCEAATSSDYPQMACGWSRSFFRWFLKRFPEKAVEYSTGDYKIIARVPDRMKFLIDEEGVGRKLNYQSPLRRDAALPTIATYSSTISSQCGLAFRHGSIWYRTEITLPKGLKTDEKNGIGLFIGGYDNTVEVFVNGVSAGTAAGFAKPAVFDVTDYLDKDGKANSLVICVTRYGNDEVCTGGLMYPGFFFTGPRVPAGKNAQLNGFRVILPGMVNE